MVRKISFCIVLLIVTHFSSHAQEPYITNIAWNADGTLLAIGWDDIATPLEIRNMATGESHFYDIGLVPDAYAVYLILAWSPTNPNRIAVANHSSWATIFTIIGEELQVEHVLDGYYSTSRIDWNTDGTRIATIGSNQCCALNYDGIQIWDTETGAIVAERMTVTPYTLNVDWHPNNADLLVYTTFENVTGTAIFQWHVSTDAIAWTTGYGEASNNIAWNPGGNLVGSLGTTSDIEIAVQLYDGMTGKIKSAFAQRSGYYTGEILWLDNNHLLVDTGILEIWNIETQQLVYQIENRQIPIAWHPISGLAYINQEDSIIILRPEDIPGIG